MLIHRLSFLVAIYFLAASLALGAQNATGSAESRREVFLVPMPREPAWQDFAFLAAIPAASAAKDGRPVVLALAADGVLTPEVRDFLARYRPERVAWIGAWIGAGPDDALVAGVTSERLGASSAAEAACALADRRFGACEHVVVVRDDDFASALTASVLAARLRVPLYICEGASLSASTRASIERRGAKKLLVVGDREGVIGGGAKMKTDRLREPVDVARWITKHGLPIEYVAVAAPADRSAGHVRKLSLSAAVLAAARSGMLVPVGTSDAPPATAAIARGVLAQWRDKLGAVPEFLCIAAMPDAIPMEAIPSGEGIDSDPPSDRAFANVDDDAFLELALGRFVAESGAAGTLLVARSVAYDALLEPSFADRFAMAEWERLAAPPFEDAGFAAPSVHTGGKSIDQASPLASVGILIHSAHSSWMQLGDTYAHDSSVLLSPCIVESAGCSPASLDQDTENRSVALRLLRNGAVAFVGNVRRGVAQQELYRTEFWNAVLDGASLGRAHRFAQNRALVGVLANDEGDRGLRRYQMYNAAFYGDPALVPHLPRATVMKRASAELSGRECIVRAPAAWWRTEAFVVPDWKYTDSAVLHGWRGAGVGVDSSWDGEHNRNREVLVYTAEVRTKLRVRGLAAVTRVEAPLGWDGRYFIDEHQDGTRSVYFRVRMFDGDPATGEVLSKIESLRLRLE